MKRQPPDPRVDQYFLALKKWEKELQELRKILLDSGLKEELKWNVPVYTLDKKNVAGIHGLKEFCALAFFKGVLLKDPEGILVRPGQNTNAGRWIKFTAVPEILQRKKILKDYIHEAMEIERSGAKLPAPEKVKMPAEFKQWLKDDPALKKSFDALTPGRQKSWLLYFSAPKHSKSRLSRIEKSLPKILKGKGMQD